MVRSRLCCNRPGLLQLALQREDLFSLLCFLLEVVLVQGCKLLLASFLHLLVRLLNFKRDLLLQGNALLFCLPQLLRDLRNSGVELCCTLAFHLRVCTQFGDRRLVLQCAR